MTSSIKLNARGLADLNAIIERYEKIDPQSGKEVVSKSWRVFNGLQLNLETIKQTMDTQKLWEQFKTDVKSNLDEFNKAAFDPNTEGSSTKVINDFFKEVYTPGKTVSREAQLKIGDMETKITGTLGGLMNAKDFGEVAGVLLNDCLPCEPRLGAMGFRPDLNFLDQLIKPILQLIDTVQSLVFTLLDTGPFKGEFCATLNVLNFVCLPDIQAINFGLIKSLQFDLSKAPGFKLPGLTDFALFLVMPFLSALVNLVQQWITAIMTPFKCAIQAIRKQIVKLSFKTKGFDPGLTIKLPDKWGLELKHKQANQFVESLDTTNGMAAAAASLAKLEQYLTKIETSIMTFLRKNIIDRFKNGMKTVQQSIASIVVWITKISEAVNFLLLFAALKNIFYTEWSQCKSKEEAFEATKEKIKENIGGLLGAGTNITSNLQDGVLNVEKFVYLTPEEIESLGLREKFPGLILIDPKDHNSESSKELTKVIISDKINVDECFQANYKETFFRFEGI